MAEVFLAVMTTGAFSKLVVIKKLREHLANDAEFVSMLLDEARIAGLLNHPNLVQTIEVGETDGEFFITMEYLDGQPLHRIVRRAQDIPLEMHLSILSDVLVGMGYAHDLTNLDGGPLNIVHRDLTPHNVFVTYQGVTKVVDFGIAKALGRASETRHGVVKGKAPYMAPEQTLGAEIDRRVDVYAIGVMVYEAAVRRRMWQGVSEMDIVSSLVAGRIPSSPKEVNPAIDDELDRICKRALAHSPGDRYATTTEMNRDLRAYLTSKGQLANSQETGEYIAKLFADKRAATNKVIEEQAAAARSLPKIPMSSGSLSSSSRTGSRSGPPSSSSGSSSTSQIIPGRGGTLVMPPTSTPKTPSAPVSSTPVVTTLKAERDASKAAAAAARSPQGPSTTTPSANDQIVAPSSTTFLTRRVMAVAAFTVAMTTAALTIFVLGSITKGTNSEKANATTSPLAPSSAVDLAAAKPITVTLRATPLETRFNIDDGPPLDNPYIGTFPRDRREHVIRATAPGYPPQRETVIFADDVSMRFTVSGRNQK
jgi:eukaryotic-like serine/threonine-protein kinase